MDRKKAFVILTSAALLAAGASGAAAQTVRFVRADAAGAGTGASWADAFTDLQAALAAAQAGDEVWVAAGTYRPAAHPPGGDRDVSFALRPGVAVYGGFAGVEIERAARDWVANPTILSGDLNDDDGEEFANSGENSYHVVTAYHVERDTVLDGFTVRGGRADGPGFGAVPESREQGSGVNIYDASPTIRNCVFERNWASNHGTVNDHGHMTVVEGCEFRGNYSDMFGAGLYIHHHSATTVTRCRFLENHSAAEGGGLYSRSQEGCTVTLCTFEANHANFGAGMYNADGSANTVTECSFRDNVAITGGAGLYAITSSPVVTRCTFIGNVAADGDNGGAGGGGGSGGGGIWTEGGAAQISGCFFTANIASFGGGCYNIHESQATITDCDFVSNQAAEAGGVYTLNSPVVVSGCRFQSNAAVNGSFSVGGAVSNYFSNSEVRDCVFDRNTAQLGGGAVYNEGEHPRVINCVFTNNTAFGEGQGWGGAILNGYFTHVDIAGCAFSRNIANNGGAIYNMIFSEPNIVNCTIVANEAIADGSNGGGLYSYFSTVARVTNCVLAANAPEQLGGDFVAVRYSCVEGGYTGPGAERVFSGDAGLVQFPGPGPDGVWETDDDVTGDLRASAGSRCIDAGDTGAVAGLLTTDVARLPRVLDDVGVPDSGAGGPPTVDIGAYEFQGRSCLADFNASGVVDSQDFFDFLAGFFAGMADVNRDGAVNSQDFFDFLGLFFAGC